MRLQELFTELKRRNVFRVAGVYAITAWLLIQIIATVFPILQLPDWSVTLLTVVILIGFPLAIIFAWAFEITPDGIKPSSHVEKNESITKQTGKKINKLTVYALSFFILFLLTERIFFANTAIIDRDNSKIENASIAVLPFVNMSGDTENEYFSDGLSEELLNALAKVEDMKVAGRTSSFKFKGQNDDLKKIGAELGVEHILEGSVRKSGDRVRITAQLIKVDDGYHMWSETYDRQLTDIFAIQEEISKTVLQELQVRLLPTETEELETIPTTDVEAYQMYLKANQLVVNRNYDEIVAAIDLYEDAVRLDPGFSEAHGRLALAYNFKAYYGNVALEEVQQQIKTSAERALALDENSAYAYAAMGTYHDNVRELDESLNMYQKALELNPNFVDVYNWMGNVYEDLDDPKSQFKTYEQGYEVDPLNPLAIYNRIRVGRYNEDWDEVELFTQKNIRINPDFIPTYYLQGNMKIAPPFYNPTEALEYFYKVIELDPNFPRAMQQMGFQAINLDIAPLAEHMFTTLRERYNQSFEYRFLVGSYANYTNDVELAEREFLDHLDGLGITPQGEGFYFAIKNYALRTGNYERVENYFRNYDPALFKDEDYAINETNLGIVQAFAELQKYKGEIEFADRLNEQACAYGRENYDQLPKGKEDLGYKWNEVTCLFNQYDFESVLPYLTEIYQDYRDVNFVAYVLEDVQEFYPDHYSDGYQLLAERIQTERDTHRAQIIEFLKTKEIWQDGWDKRIGD